jgi:hypothetical protein
MSLLSVATAMAAVFCWVWPRTPMKNDVRVAPIVTSRWSGKPAFVDGATGGRSTRTVRPPVAST